MCGSAGKIFGSGGLLGFGRLGGPDSGGILSKITGGKSDDILDPLGLYQPDPPPPTPEPYPTLAQANAPESIDEAQLQARARERRRAALRFGRASTIGAGSVGAPAGSGNRLLGS